MKKDNKLSEYSLQVTLNSYDTIIDHLNAKYGEEYSKRNPGVVTCLMRFHEEVFRSTSELISKEKLDVKSLESVI